MKKLFVLAITTLTLAACQESLEEKAAREAQMYTKKNCPARISETVIMDSMTFEKESHTIHYYYTLTGAADSLGITNKEEARGSLLAALKNTPSLAIYKDDGYRFAYTYHSQSVPDTILFEAAFTSDDY